MNDHRNAVSRPGSGLWGPPSAIAFVFLALAILVPAVFGNRILNTDGDLASHIFLGKQVIEHGMTFPVYWAHSMPGGTFVAYEWLSGMVFARLFDFGGLAAILIASTLAIASSMTLIAAVLRRRLSPLILMPVVFLAALLTANHWVIRPHLYSFIGLAILLTLVSRPLTYKHLPVIGILFALWANLHPGFVYGLIMFGAFLAGDVLDRGWKRIPWRHVALFSVAFGATFLNPLGWALHVDIIHALGDARPFELIEEFRYTSPTNLAGFVFYATLALAVTTVLVAKRMPKASTMLAFGAAAFFAISAERHVSLFALFALPLFLLDYAPDLQARIPKALAGVDRSLTRDDVRGTTLPWIAAPLVVLFILAATSGRLGSLQVLPNSFSGDVFPVEAVEKARAADLAETRFFHSYAWGGYFLHAWPEQRIYIDGMANYFGGDLVDEYVTLNSAAPGWEEILSARKIDAILVKVDSRIAKVARDHPGWSVWHEDPTAILLRRR